MVRQEAAKYSDWDIIVMVAISSAESGCDANALGDTSLEYEQDGRKYGYSVSAFQVRVLPGREHCDSYELSTNVECAHQVWQGQGYTAWSVYQSGKYQQYL